MGCNASANEEPEDNIPQALEGSEDDSPEKVQARQQRRRLSVKPTHVGDVTKAAAEFNANRRGSTVEDKGDDTAGLSELELKAKGSIHHAGISKKGFVPYNRSKVNQDRYVIKYAVGGDKDVNLFGVMDGHGEFGHYVAAHVEENLPRHLANVGDLKTGTHAKITEACANMCDALTETKINLAFSGTTCVFGLKIGDALHVANIGDSRCVLASRHQDDPNKLKVQELSDDHKPENPEEKARILAAGGRVATLPGLPDEDCGPFRVWLAEVDVPGLAMSRSIGDEVSQMVGVISTPEIIQYQVTSDNLFMILASDGVWEFLSSEDACHIVWEHRDNLYRAAKALVAASHQQWRAQEEVVDDITCVIVQLNPFDIDPQTDNVDDFDNVSGAGHGEKADE